MAKLTASDAAARDLFGFAVALDGRSIELKKAAVKELAGEMAGRVQP